MAAEDIRNLQLWTCQERRALGGQLGLGLLFGLVLDLAFVGRSGVRRSSGLMTSRIVLVATRV